MIDKKDLSEGKMTVLKITKTSLKVGLINSLNYLSKKQKHMLDQTSGKLYNRKNI